MSRTGTKYADLATSNSGGLKQGLSLPELSSFGISSSAPLTVVAGALVVMSTLGVPGMPVVFIAVSLVVALWTVGYVALSRRVQSAGAQAAFISHGLGRTAGVMAQGLAVVGYFGMYLCLYGLFGAVTAPLVTKWAGLTAPWWVWSLVCAVAVGLLGRTRVKLIGRVLTVLLALEVAAVMLIIVGGFIHPAGGHVDFADLSPVTLINHGKGGVGGLVALTFACIVGFEETPGLASETRDGKTNAGWAVIIAVAVCGVLYALATLAQSVGEGPANLAAVAADPTSGFPFDLIVGAFGSAGPALAVVAAILLATSLFAAMASFHTVITRYLFAAGRDQVVPARLGRINPRNSSPSNASHAATAVEIAVIVAFAIVGADPITGLFVWGSYIGAIGVLTLMIGSSIAVVGYFRRRQHESPSIWVTTIAPIVAAVLMLGLWLTILTNSATMIGAPAFGVLHLALLVIPTLALMLAYARAKYLRRHRPDIWVDVAGYATELRAAAAFAVSDHDPRKVYL